MIFFDGLQRDTFGPGDHERPFGSLWTAGRVGMVHKYATATSVDQMIAARWKPAPILHAFGLTDVDKIGNLGMLPGTLSSVLG